MTQKNDDHLQGETFFSFLQIKYLCGDFLSPFGCHNEDHEQQNWGCNRICGWLRGTVEKEGQNG